MRACMMHVHIWVYAHPHACTAWHGMTGPDANPMFYRPNIEGVSGIIEIEDFDQIWCV